VVQQWVAREPELRRDDATNVCKHLRLPLVSLRDLMKVVRPSGLVPLEQIMDAVEYVADPAAMHEAALAHPARFAPRATSTVTSAPQRWHADVRGPQITISNGGRTAYQVIPSDFFFYELSTHQ
jgi:hypothetical protein